MLLFVEGGKPEKSEKNPRGLDENQQQTQPTYGTGPESNPGHIVESWEATVRSSHWVIPTLPSLLSPFSVILAKVSHQQLYL